MFRHWKILAIGMCLVSSMPSVTHAEDPLFQWNIPMRRGAFVLTDMTPGTLLQSGYALVAVFEDPRLNVSVGAIASGSVPLASATTLYFQKASDVIRCTEELPAYTAMVCWRLAPVPVEINGRPQADHDLNPIVGTWSGTYPNHPELKLTVTITDSPTDRAIAFAIVGSPRGSGTIPVLFYEGRGEKITARYNPAGNMNAFHNSATFQVLNENKIAWVESPFEGIAVLVRDPNSVPGPGPQGAIQPGTVTVRPNQ